MEKKYLKELSEIRLLSEKIRSLHESLSFADEYDDERGMVDPEYEMGGDEKSEYNGDLAKAGEEMQPEEDENGLDSDTEVDEIREIALKGMIRLCKKPEDPKYQSLKKVFNMLDKAVDPNNQQQQQQPQQQMIQK